MLITPHHYENFSTKRIFCKQPRIITFLAGHNEYDSDYCNKAIESYPATAQLNTALKINLSLN